MKWFRDPLLRVLLSRKVEEARHKPWLFRITPGQREAIVDRKLREERDR
jgi:hypothetical protein